MFSKSISSRIKRFNYLGMGNFVILLSLFLLTFLTPLNLEAKEVIFGSDLSFTDQTVDQNYYFAGVNIKIDASFSRDLIIAGGKVYVGGEVVKDVIVIGGEVYLNNYVQGDLRILGGTVNLASTIDGDLIVIGGRVNLLEEADIRGETLIIGGQVKQNTPIVNTSDIIAGTVILNSRLDGDSEITTQNIILDSRAEIVGNLYYYSPVKAQEKTGSQIIGTVNFNQINTIRETGVIKTVIINAINFWIILKFITTLILTFILIQLFKVFAQGVNDIGARSFFKSFVLGILSLILLPMLFGILVISLIGLPIGLLMILIYIIIWSLSAAFSGIIMGSLITHLLDRNRENKVTFPNAVIGIILLTAVQFVPIAGDLTILIFSFVSVGAIIRYIYRHITSHSILKPNHNA